MRRTASLAAHLAPRKKPCACAPACLLAMWRGCGCAPAGTCRSNYVGCLLQLIRGECVHPFTVNKFAMTSCGSGHTCSFSYSFSWFSWLARLPFGRSGRFRMLGLWLTIDICGNRSWRHAACVPVEAKGPTVSCAALSVTLREGRILVLSPRQCAGQRRLTCLVRCGEPNAS